MPAKRTPAATKTASAAKPRARSAPAGGEPKRQTGVDLQALGARVLSVFGPFDCRVLIEMSSETAAMMFPASALGAAGPRRVIDAVERELEALRRRAPELADSGLAASALAMAYELEHPFNSATAKAACARSLQDALRELRSLAPPEAKQDAIDEIGERRAKRRAGVANTAD